jgi:hypothetical protein
VKRWAALTVALYAVTLLILSVPVVLVAFGKWTGKSEPPISVREAIGIIGEWGCWVWLALMASGQALLLIVPVRIARNRPVSRRSLLAPILATGFFFGHLVLMALTSAVCVAFKDKAFDIFGAIGELTLIDARHHLVTGQFLQNAGLTPASLDYLLGMFTVTLVFWLIWTLVFYAFARNDTPDSLVKRATRWLLRGSVLELLVAVPSHVIVRQRNDCCAPFSTFWGITTGLSVMLLAFGPGVFFLFAARCARLQPKAPEPGKTDLP